MARSGPATATEISADLPVSRQPVAKHLAALNEVGLVERSEVGREVRFSFNPSPLGEVVEWASQVGDTWEQRVDNLQAIADE